MRAAALRIDHVPEANVVVVHQEGIQTLRMTAATAKRADQADPLLEMVEEMVGNQQEMAATDVQVEEVHLVEVHLEEIRHRVADPQVAIIQEEGTAMKDPVGENRMIELRPKSSFGRERGYPC